MRFSVTDTGPEIAPQHRERLFSAFEQVDNSATHRHEGIGLGLYICRRLAELLGASVWLDSKPGRGSTFCLEIPC